MATSIEASLQHWMALDKRRAVEFEPSFLAKSAAIKTNLNENAALAVPCILLVVNMKKEGDPLSAGRQLDLT